MDDFSLKTKKETVVSSNGTEIARFDGHILISGKDYEGQLPVEVRHITTTYQVINVIKIEKGGEA